jgi:hypothetical protein
MRIGKPAASLNNINFLSSCVARAALVGVHPLGRLNMLGTGYWAGGRDHLPLLNRAKPVSEALKRPGRGGGAGVGK